MNKTCSTGVGIGGSDQRANEGRVRAGFVSFVLTICRLCIIYKLIMKQAASNSLLLMSTYRGPY
jgi:hypothetical protein